VSAAGFHGKDPHGGEIPQALVEVFVNFDFGEVV